MTHDIGIQLMLYNMSKETESELVSDIPEVARLNQIFNNKWSFAIVESGVTLNNQEYVLQGRLFILGAGFRDGIGASHNLEEAKLKALRNAMEMFGIKVQQMQY